MPSVFISYSHDPADSTHAERVAGLAASLLEGGLEVFFDQNRGEEEEKVPWEIWMEDKILEADHVLMVCTELYRKKIRQEVAEDEGQGVCWEAGVIFALLYQLKRNTTKFLPVLFSPADKCFIPLLLQGKQRFVVDTQSGYERLYAFLTGQHRARFPKRGAALQTVDQKTIKPLFAPPGKTATPVPRADLALTLDKAVPAINPQLRLKLDTPPAPRQDIRGLDWYDECDASHFLGRNDDADRVLPMLLSHPVIRLVGPSGVGKSSLIRAGLLPKIRKFGWRACVIRPFEDPARRVPIQLTAELLTSPGAFTGPLDPAKFRSEVTPLLLSNGITRLVLVLDQFEDIVSPVAAPTAVDAIRKFLEELWQQKEMEPYLRAVVVYRTDAEARLGRLWQEVSGRPEGLPYLALEGLSHSVAETIINQTAREQGWRLETSVPEIVRQLALESQKLDCSGEVFPVYLQIFLKQAEQNTEGRTTTEFIASVGGVAGLIGKYLEQTLGRLKARGGEWQQCGAVLESLSRSTGAKAAQSLNDLVRETGVSRDVLAEMLPVLINERLVRPVGHETYEIQHDRLAAAVIESMKDSDREAKAAREFLAAKVPVFERTMILLTPGELVYLYRYRRKIHPTERELRLLLASMMHNIETGHGNKSAGAYWLGESSAQDLLHRFIQIEHWAGEERGSFSSPRGWAETFPIRGLESQFSALAADPFPSIRAICAQWIGRTIREEDLPLLRELAKDGERAVRAEAVRALAYFQRPEVLPLLRELAKDENPAVRAEAMRTLASFPVPEALPLLQELAKHEERAVRAEAVRALAGFPRLEDLPLLRELARDKYWDVRAEAVETLTNFSRAKDLPLLRELAKDENRDVRAEAVRMVTSFPRPEVLPLLRELARDGDRIVRAAAVRALAGFPRLEDLPLLQELARDKYWDVRAEAMRTLASFRRPEVLPLVCELVKDENRDVRAGAVRTLAGFLLPDVLPLLQELAKDENWDVRAEVVSTLASFRLPEVLPLLRELAKDDDRDVRAAAVATLTSFSRTKDLPLLRELLKDENRDVRAESMRTLASFSVPEDLPLLRELLKDENPTVRAEAVRTLAGFPRLDVLPLLRELAKDDDRDVRAVVVETLTSFSRTKDLPLLRELLKDENPALRAEAVRTLAGFPGPEVLPLLQELAKDKNWDVRAEVVSTLASFRLPEVLPLLRELLKDENPAVRAEAMRTLAGFPRLDVLPLLRELAKYDDLDVRAVVVETLTSFSRTKDLPLLRELLKDENPALRAEAMRTLAGFPVPEVLPLLRELLKDENPAVRAEAVRTLADFSRPEDLPLLQELALEPDDNVAAEAVRGLILLCSREVLEAFLNRNDQELCAGALAALDELLYMPEWLKRKDREQER